MVSLVFLMVLLGACAAHSLQIIMSEGHTTSSCSSPVDVNIPSAIANRCVLLSTSLSTKGDCSAKTVLAFPNGNCTGEPSQSYTIDNCTDGANPSYSAGGYVCRDIPASNLLTYEKGAGCAADGSVTSLSSSALMTFPACRKLSSSDSYQISVSNNVVTGLVYNTSSECTGTIRETITGVLGQCENGVKLSSVSGAGTLGLSSLVAGAIAVVAMVSL